MTTPFIGEIQLFGFNFAPVGWATCAGSLLPISQNTALFSLIGTTYGGNGQSTFALPNFQGRAPTNQGHGPGLSTRTIGEPFGEAQVTLIGTEIPSHNHQLNLYVQRDPSKRSASPQNGYGLTFPGNVPAFVTGTQPNMSFHPNSVGPDGGSQAHENRQPYLAVNFCIALEGVYPSFS
ncbi:phage tail protein [Oleiagrimonas soli]|uniref:Microcystin-dependent protein n=1 Tax=Oleiagrimonas soli TaxID=1543381 RepID=A0A099CZN9_9GAMM|nr:tail fiber protein [Oleiagrimonas soli]KGI79264.1 microcystin-dependent protein [Oleiagrimonas soli]MBB6184836.1 microcystin-dependent protein [Oleiagrimonas soli]